jgi:hypothetical protein
MSAIPDSVAVGTPPPNQRTDTVPSRMVAQDRTDGRTHNAWLYDAAKSTTINAHASVENHFASHPRADARAIRELYRRGTVRSHFSRPTRPWHPGKCDAPYGAGRGLIRDRLASVDDLEIAAFDLVQGVQFVVVPA